MVVISKPGTRIRCKTRVISPSGVVCDSRMAVTRHSVLFTATIRQSTPPPGFSMPARATPSTNGVSMASRRIRIRGDIRLTAAATINTIPSPANQPTRPTGISTVPTTITIAAESFTAAGNPDSGMAAAVRRFPGCAGSGLRLGEASLMMGWRKRRRFRSVRAPTRG